MDTSSEQRSQDENRVQQRQLYRAGQTPPSTGTRPGAPSRSVAKKDSSTQGQRILQGILLLGVGYYLLYGTPTQRGRVLKGLAAAVWLIFLCGASYCIFLPDLEGLAKERREIWSDKSLTFEEKKDKMRDMEAKLKNLTPEQRKQMRAIDQRERTRKGNASIVKFLQLTPEERMAETKKRMVEMEKMRAKWGARNKGKGPNNAGKGNGNAKGNRQGGPGGGGRGFGGGGGGPGGGGGGGGLPGGDNTSPESRAGRPYQMGLFRQMGGFGGGQGGGKR